MKPDVRAAFALLGGCGLACFALGSVPGLVAVGTLGLALTGRYAHLKAQGPGGFHLEARGRDGLDTPPDRGDAER